MTSKKTRFEVFKRDKFTCQYCGQSAPDVTLEVDHIHPKAKGGKDDILNYVTSCFDCNRGKSDRLLSDDSVIKARKKQLDNLQERKEQLEMMFEWQLSLLDIDEQIVDGLHSIWRKLTGYVLTNTGKGHLRKICRKYKPIEIAEAMKVSARQYLMFDDDATYIQESVDKAFNTIASICAGIKRDQGKPHLGQIRYCRGILNNRLDMTKAQYHKKCIELMDIAYTEDRWDTEQMKEMCKTVSTWEDFAWAIEEKYDTWYNIEIEGAT